jgi:hypothetical protein
MDPPRVFLSAHRTVLSQAVGHHVQDDRERNLFEQFEKTVEKVR